MREGNKKEKKKRERERERERERKEERVKKREKREQWKKGHNGRNVSTHGSREGLEVVLLHIGFRIVERV